MALNINGTTGISGVDGSASAPALTGTDSNTGINFGSDTVNINTGGTSKVEVQSNGAINVPSHLPIKIGGTERANLYSDGRLAIGDALSGMGLGFGIQQFSSRSGTNSAAIFGSDSNSLTALIVYNSTSGYATHLVDLRSQTSNSTAWYFIRASSSNNADNEYFLGGNGASYADGGSSFSVPADYAEMFEWSDSNSSNEDRRGYTVVLDGNKIKIATSSDSTDNIIGVVSGNPAVVGDSAWNKWTDKYKKDDFNCYIRDSDGYRVLNAEYDDSKTYIPRSERQEWDAIGMVGKLRIKKGQITGTRWLKMRDISDTVEEWLVR